MVHNSSVGPEFSELYNVSKEKTVHLCTTKCNRDILIASQLGTNRLVSINVQKNDNDSSPRQVCPVRQISPLAFRLGFQEYRRLERDCSYQKKSLFLLAFHWCFFLLKK